MATLYTPAGGSTPQGQASQGLVDALQQITGGALSPAQTSYAQTALAYPQQAAGVQQAATQQQGMPGLIGQYGDQAKILDMFAHDQTLAQKYGASPTQIGAMTIPGQGGVPATSTPGLSASSNVAPFTGLTDPGAITKAMGMDVSAHSNILDLVSKAVDFGSSQIQKSTAANADAYKSVMDVMSMLIQADEKAKDRALEREKLAGTKVSVSLPEGGNKAQIRKAYQEAWYNAPDTTTQDKIAASFKNAYKSSLFPDEPSSTQMTDINNTNRMISDLKKVRRNIVSGELDSYMGGVGGNWANLLTDPKLASALPDKVHETAQILRSFQAVGERSAVGGRITGYLMDRLAPAFPNLAQGKVKILDSVDRYIENGETNMDNTARSLGYSGIDEFPYYQIAVREKSTGKIGRLPANEFDPNIYEKL